MQTTTTARTVIDIVASRQGPVSGTIDRLIDGSAFRGAIAHAIASWESNGVPPRSSGLDRKGRHAALAARWELINAL